MKTMNLYKVTYNDPDAPGVCIKGDTPVEKYFVANTYNDVLTMCAVEDIVESQIRDISYVRGDVIVDNRPKWHVTDYETGEESVIS